MIVDDFNGDSKPDVAGFKSSSGIFSVYLNDGAGNFGDAITVNLGVQPATVTVADLNNDNKKDLVLVKNTFPTSVVTYTNNGSGGFALWNTTVIQGQPGLYLDSKAIIQVNGDNRPDLVARNIYYPLNENGTFSPGESLNLEGVTLVGDYNGDGKGDLVQHFQGAGEYHTVLNINNGTGSAFTRVFLANRALNLISFTDLNNDGKLDIVGADNTTSTRKLVVFLSNSAGGFAQTEYALPNYQEEIFALKVKFGDFNGDGFKDLLIPDYNNSQLTNVFLFGSASGNFALSNSPRRVQSFLFADFDSDGKTDYLTVARNQLFSYGILTLLKSGCERRGQTKIVDFDGDGTNDLALWRASDGRWTIRNSSNGIVHRVFWGRGDLGDVPALGDYDGDGKTDIAVWRASNQVWYILRSADNAPQYLQWGLSEDKLTPGDYDGDGKTDIAVFRRSNGVWYVRKSSDGALFAVQFGIAEDKPTPADYDGDNKTDIAVWRPSTGVWYRLNSADSYNFAALQWGAIGDKPAPADYDGDGKADFTVFRPSSGIWYLRTSYNDSVAGYQFGSSEDFIVPTNYMRSNGAVTFAQLGVYRPSAKRWYISSGQYADYFDFGDDGEVPVSALPRVE